MASIEELRERMDRAAQIEDPLDRRLWILAVITEFLAPSGVKPILVGGAAVEFYTAGGYFTFDIDVVAETQAMAKAMSELGFQKEGRHWIREDLQAAIEAPSSTLAGDDVNRLLTINVENMSVYVIGIEDIIIDRLNAYVHWDSTEDSRWVRHLIQENEQDIDWAYLKARAKAEKTSEALEAILLSLSEGKQ